MNIKHIISTFLSSFVDIMGEMAPYLLLGFFFAGLLHVFVPKQSIQKYFSGGTLKSSVFASLFGIPLPICSCGVIPTGIALYKNGASKAGTVSFLISTPQTGVDSILATFSLMGLPFAIVRAIAALITGVSGGLITGVVTKEHSTPTIVEEHEVPSSFTLKQKLIKTFQYGFIEFVQDIAKWLVVGIVLAAAISAIIPDNYIQLLNLSPLVQMFMVLLVSVPLYICATGSIPLAMVLILKGVSPGAAFVLLMAGPATNIATITMIGKVLGKRSLFTYLFSIITGSIVFGLIIDYMLPQEWFTVLKSHTSTHHAEVGIVWIKNASSILLVVLLFYTFIKKTFTKKENNGCGCSCSCSSDASTKTINIHLIVEGMGCNKCKANVEIHVSKLDGVSNVQVDLGSKSVLIDGKHIDVEKVKNEIRSLGYIVKT